MALKLLFVLLLCAVAFADLDSHIYDDGEDVIVWANKVGPFRNPQETYLYYSLPFCKPSQEIDIREGLGEALQGYELIKSNIIVNFKKNRHTTTLCEKTLEDGVLEAFRYAVKNQYWYQLFIDDLPVWGMVGEILEDPSTEDKLFLYTHQKFVLSYKEDRVIEVNLTSENPVPLEKGNSVTFTYSVNWYATEMDYENRFDKYLDNNFFEHQIHWFSIFNSFMMVIFLVGLVSMILMRTLKKDYARFERDEDEVEADRDVGDESGWKQIHGDVFRQPPHLVLFSALIGTGHQLVLLVFSVLTLSMIGLYYRHRGYIVTAFIICYAFTSFVGGYGGGGFYARNGGKNWMKVMFLTAGMFPGVCILIAFLLNFVAVSYGSLNSIPVGTMIAVMSIWIFLSFPLTLIGTVIGKNWNGQLDKYPCRVNQVPRQIPERSWYLHRWVHVVLGGILPFGSIFIEMYFVFTSFWHYKYYYVYGFMLLVFIILILVTVCVDIVSTYFLLNSEDYRWHWVSFLSPASTAVYVYLYSIYYFFGKTKMSGLLQTSFYFGYMLMFCFGLAILCGSVGFIGTSIFVRRIYRNVKID